MVLLFWTATILLSLTAVAIFFPWLKLTSSALVSSTIILLLSYGFYYQFGSSQHLKTYYSGAEKKNRAQMQRIRPLMAELKKQEYRLRFHLEENPKDTLVQSQLLELLAIQAMQAGDSNLAKQFLLKAIDILPNLKQHLTRKEHLQELLKTNF